MKARAVILWLIFVAVFVLLFNRFRVMIELNKTRLSQNFSLGEFVVTATGLDNIPDAGAIQNLRSLVVNVLQPLRSALGRPVTISSGYRSKAVNNLISGADTSQHLTGEAADIQVKGLTPPQIVKRIQGLNLPFDQLIDEQVKGRSWVHVSYRNGSNRSQALSAREGSEGQTVYSTFLG